MLIQRAPDAYEKLQVLGGMAGDDVLAPSTTEKRLLASRPPSPANRHGQPGIYRAAMPGGKFISLMRVMFTDLCLSIGKIARWASGRRSGLVGLT